MILFGLEMSPTDEPMLDAESRCTLARLAGEGRIYDLVPRGLSGALHVTLALGALCLVGVIGLVIGFVFVSQLGSNDLGRALGILALLGIPVIAGALRWHRYGRRLSRGGALHLLLHGHGPFFLYLRPFRADRENPATDEVFERAVSGRGDIGEEDLAQMLRRTGPLVALGRPHEKLSLLGARRFYVAR